MARRKLKYYTIEGTSLKYSQITRKKLIEGRLSPENFARTIARSNPEALKGLYSNPRKEFNRLVHLPQVHNTSDAMEIIKNSYRSSLYTKDKGRLLTENMRAIIVQIMDNTELEAMMGELNIDNLDFVGWKWNDQTHRLEDPEGTVWISIEGSSKTDGYEGKIINYGRI